MLLILIKRILNYLARLREQTLICCHYWHHAKMGDGGELQNMSTTCSDPFSQKYNSTEPTADYIL